MPLRVTVVGAGIIGLATASELIRAGAEVRLYEKDRVAGGQSKGLTRIFRQAHGAPHLVALAMRARGKWRAWEEHSGRRLVGGEGLIVSGEDTVHAWSAAMDAAGAPHHLLSEAECRELLPIGQVPVIPALFDPAGGATRVRRTVEFLQAEIGPCLQSAEVIAIEANGHACVVRTAHEAWACDEVVIASGLDTSQMARQVGLDVPTEVRLHSRFTFELREPYRSRAQSCWIDDRGAVGAGWHSYAQPVGTTGRYAVGVSWENQQCSLEVGADTVSRESLEVARQYVTTALPGLDPQPVDEIRCADARTVFQDASGDGFGAVRRDRITALYGCNLFKFAPLIGELLAQGAVQGTLATELNSMIASR